MGCMYMKNKPRWFIPDLFRATTCKHLSPDEKTKATAITVNFSNLGLTLKDIPRFGDAGASLQNEHTCDHLQGLIISSQPLLSSKFLQYGSNSHSLIQVRINCWECDKMWCNAETDIQWRLIFPRNYEQILLLIWQKWDGLLADTRKHWEHCPSEKNFCGM